MWNCGHCGKEAARGKVSFDPKGNPVRERCSNCAPEEFDAPFRMPTDQRIYSGPEAMPRMYTRDRDGMYHAKDELIADTAAGWDEGPTARAIAHKQKTRRTEPMSRAEIEANKRIGEQVLGPIIREHGIAGIARALHQKE